MLYFANLKIICFSRAVLRTCSLLLDFGLFYLLLPEVFFFFFFFSLSSLSDNNLLCHQMVLFFFFFNLLNLVTGCQLNCYLVISNKIMHKMSLVRSSNLTSENICH